jgi:hypothetical protein
MRVIRRLHTSAYRPPKNSMFLGACTLEFDALGIRTSRPGITATYDWSRFQNIDREGGRLYLWIDGFSGLIVPLRSLPDNITADAADILIRSLYADGRLKSAISDASAPSTASVTAKPTLLHRLNDVCRLWLLKSSKDISSMATERWIVAIALLTLGLWVGIDWLQAGPDPHFTSFNVPALGCYVLLALGAALIASRASTPRIPFRSALYILTAVAPFLIGAWWLINTRILRAFTYLELLLGEADFGTTKANLTVGAIIAVLMLQAAGRQGPQRGRERPTGGRRLGDRLSQSQHGVPGQSIAKVRQPPARTPFR